VWHQFLKDSDKLPGWVPLYVVTMAANTPGLLGRHLRWFGV